MAQNPSRGALGDLQQHRREYPQWLWCDLNLSLLDLIVAGIGAFAAGVVNALAGGGTLISFPILVAIGVPALPANITNTVALTPGYFSGTLAQRADLIPQMARTKQLAAIGLAGGLAGSVLLEMTPNHAFSAAVPWLILISCILLLVQNKVRNWVRVRTNTRSVSGTSSRHPLGLFVTVFFAAVYGGFFGAGLGIMLLGLLGLFTDDNLVHLNALKQALSLVINLCAAVLFAITGNVRWQLVPVMAIAALFGGHLGGRLSRIVNPTLLRWTVVVFGVAVAIKFWLK